MTRDELDWPVIKFSTITFIIIVLVSIILIFASWTFKEKMLSEHKKNKMRFTTITQKYLAVDEDEKIIRQHYPEFIAL